MTESSHAQIEFPRVGGFEDDLFIFVYFDQMLSAC